MLLITLNAEQKRLLVISTVCFSAHLALLLSAFPVARSHAEALTLTPAPAYSLRVKLTNLPASTPLDTIARVPPVNKSVAESAPPLAKKTEQSKSVAEPVRSIAKQKSTAKEKADITVNEGGITKNRAQPAAPSSDSASPSIAAKPASAKPASTKPAINTPSAATKPSGSSQPVLSQTTNSHDAAPRFRRPPEPPVYPAAARQRKQEGTAIIEVELSASGNAERISLVRSSGFPLLDRAALQAVKRWQFLPKQIDGVGMAHQVRIPVRFQLT